MKLEILLSARAEQDITLQYRCYLDHADGAVAEHYLRCVMKPSSPSQRNWIWADVDALPPPNWPTFAAFRFENPLIDT